MVFRLSLYQLSRLKSLVSLAIEQNNKFIETHNEYLRSLSEDDLSNLDDFDLNYSEFLEKDNDFLVELKQSLDRGVEK